MDYKLFKAINQLAGRSQLIDRIMVTITKKGRYIFILLFLFMWFRNYFYKKVTLYAILSFTITFVLTFWLKVFHYKPRPYLKHSVSLLRPFPSKKDSSFPSKHTSLSFSLAVVVLLYHRLLGLIMLSLAFLTGFSRIWMGQHYPSDIIRSAILGSITAFIVNLFKKLWEPFFSRIIDSYNFMVSSLKIR